jgi:hypothetical protein
MNKNFLKISLPIFFALAAIITAPQKAFSLSAGDNLNATASVSFASFPLPSDVYINHTQSLKVLTSSNPTVIDGVLTSTIPGTTITSVKVLYTFDLILNNTISTVTATITPGPNNSTNFSVTINDILIDKGSFYYMLRIEYSAGGVTKVKESPWYVANNPDIRHTPLTAISAADRIFSPIANADSLYLVDNSFYPSANMVPAFEMEYYYNDNSVNSSTVGLRFISSGNYYELENGSIIVPLDVSTVSYRIGVRYNGEIDRIKWFPLTGYINVPLVSASSSTIGAGGGTVELPNGDQHTDNTDVTVEPGELDEDTDIIIIEHPTDGSIGAKYSFVATQDIVKLTEIQLSASYNKSYKLTFTTPDTKDYEIYYATSKTGPWTKLDATKNLQASYTVQWTSAKYGNLSPTPPSNFFAVKTLIARNVNSSVRPVNRAFMPGGSVRFNSLKDGDSVTIYNLKGKLVRKLTPAAYQTYVDWDGRNSKGDYVESGSYVYQVKADGKIISGSLAFVR